jgi:membrane-bound metal-dependent hydrolase YbcI (DUF457 family)
VDVATHLLTSLALSRGFFPRKPWRFLIVVTLAGTLADVDLLTILFGPSAYLSGRHTWTHSILGTVAIIAIATLLGFLFEHRARLMGRTGTSSLTTLLLAASLAAIAHLLMDLATSQGVAVLWPFQSTRFAWDLLPTTDPWILALLLAALLLPELFALVSSEIGAKDKAPRGRNAALIALALICIYAGGRFLLHANAAAQLDAHSYRGESPRRVAALPDTLSLFTWHGIAETTSQICTTSVPATSALRFDPETAACVHKPDPSAVLAAALQTDAAQRFVAASQFPRASVSALDFETEVVLRDVRDLAEGEDRFALAASIVADSKSQVSSQHIVWARSVRLR